MDGNMPIGLRFSLLHRSFKKKMDEMLAEKELTGVQFGVMGALMRMERCGKEEISQRDLEEATRLAHPTMTEILKRLEKKEFLRAEQSGRDRRCKCIHATEKAYLLRDEIAEVENETFSWLCKGLSPEQIEALLSATDVMLQNAREDCKKGRDCGCD
jgi:DNA-binding MarR family transcriptional regulator